TQPGLGVCQEHAGNTILEVFAPACVAQFSCGRMVRNSGPGPVGVAGQMGRPARPASRLAATPADSAEPEHVDPRFRRPTGPWSVPAAAWLVVPRLTVPGPAGWLVSSETTAQAISTAGVSAPKRLDTAY